MQIRYYGFPSARGPIVRLVDDDRPKTQPRDLPVREDLAPHSDGFAWGRMLVAGVETNAMPKGAAQLACALCAHALDDDRRAVRLYQRFKMRVMESWHANEPWTITIEEVAAVCDEIEDLERETKGEVRKVAAERELGLRDTGGTNFGKGPIVWHTDDNGDPIPGADTRGDE